MAAKKRGFRGAKMVPPGNVPDVERHAGHRQTAPEPRPHGRKCAAPSCLDRAEPHLRLCANCQALVG